MTKRWKSMSNTVHDIVCMSRREFSKGMRVGIGIGGTGKVEGTRKVGTATSLTVTPCVHAQNAQHVIPVLRRASRMSH
jgi:hypothetical protein